MNYKHFTIEERCCLREYYVKGKSYREIARLLNRNVSPRFLADVEGGNVGVSIQTLKKICCALKISSDFLLGLKNSNDCDERGKLTLSVLSLDEKFFSAVAALTEELNKIN